MNERLTEEELNDISDRHIELEVLGREYRGSRMDRFRMARYQTERWDERLDNLLGEVVE